MMRPINYEQTDPRWASLPYTVTGDPAQTIGATGCGPTCAAMVVATLRKPAPVTPPEACAWAINHGYRTEKKGTDFAFFIPYLASWGIPATYTWDRETAISALRDGKMVIGRATKGRWTSDGHFILGYGIADERVLINDPYSVSADREAAPIQDWMEQVAPYWIIEEPWQEEQEAPETVTIRVEREGEDPERVELEGFLRDGRCYIWARELAKIFPEMGVGWDDEARSVVFQLPAGTEAAAEIAWHEARIRELREAEK